jgi:hypothetical protein
MRPPPAATSFPKTLPSNSFAVSRRRKRRAAPESVEQFLREPRVLLLAQASPFFAAACAGFFGAGGSLIFA